MRSHRQINDFRDTVWQYYRENSRPMPWRDDPSPYNVLVSELMLQQTQVPRVLPKFAEFMAVFPGLADLATATLPDVLRVWSGLGYNRRAKFLHAAAQKVMADYGGQLPAAADELVRLPGIGPNTAGAIMAYVYNKPAVFIETNIRSVHFYHFFADRTDVDDKELRELVARTLDQEHPREWYWALMDYGTHLKTKVRNISQSRHYRKQSAFEGSRRQLRARVLRLLLAGPQPERVIAKALPDSRLPEVLVALQHEGFIAGQPDLLRLAGGVSHNK